MGSSRCRSPGPGAERGTELVVGRSCRRVCAGLLRGPGGPRDFHRRSLTWAGAARACLVDQRNGDRGARSGSRQCPRCPGRCVPACHTSFGAAPVGQSAGGTRRAPAACWCARTTVESALTVQPRPLASSLAMSGFIGADHALCEARPSSQFCLRDAGIAAPAARCRDPSEFNVGAHGNDAALWQAEEIYRALRRA
jgi:hypothetical protein